MSVSLADLLPDAPRDPSSDVLRPLPPVHRGQAPHPLPGQEEASLELFDGKNVVLNTPTGSGKSLVASAMLFASLARRQRAVYTCPIKALVNEKTIGTMKALLRGVNGISLIGLPDQRGGSASATVRWMRASHPSIRRDMRCISARRASSSGSRRSRRTTPLERSAMRLAASGSPSASTCATASRWPGARVFRPASPRTWSRPARRTPGRAPSS